MDTTSEAAIHRRDATHPDGQYARLSKLFHWLTVPLMLLAISIGLVIRFMKDEVKLAFYTLHESTGLLILALALARLLVRHLHPAPALPAHIPRANRLAANTVHTLLYVALILQPVLGFVMTNAYGFPLRGDTAFLGFIDLPKFMEPWEGLAVPLHWAHSLIGWTLPFLLAAHIGGAIYHHAIRGDGTLMRML